MKTKIKISLIHNPISTMGKPYQITRLSGAVTVEYQAPGQRNAEVFRAGDHLTEKVAEAFASWHDVTVTPAP